MPLICGALDNLANPLSGRNELGVQHLRHAVRFGELLAQGVEPSGKGVVCNGSTLFPLRCCYRNLAAIPGGLSCAGA